tara:strand:+ start:306 stop:914 length:609 start_codon:yes stop_codon:yes gene_type:complete
MALVKHTNNSLSNITALPSAVPTGKMTLLSTATASSSASLSFNSTYINGDYQIYKFEFINIHPQNNNDFQFNISTDNGSNYNVTKTSTYFTAAHAENNVEASVAYNTPRDLAQGTGYQFLSHVVGNGNDESLSGSMTLFNPSSTVFVKHFISDVHIYEGSDYALRAFCAGYGNTTSAVNAISFRIETGNIDAGQIKLYGLAN